MNWYAYCNNNPVGFVDPSGKSAAVAATSGIIYFIVEYGSYVIIGIAGAITAAYEFLRISSHKIKRLSETPFPKALKSPFFGVCQT